MKTILFYVHEDKTIDIYIINNAFKEYYMISTDSRMAVITIAQ